MSNSRKYVIDLQNTKSYGIGSKTELKTVSLLIQFTYNGIEYDSITLGDLEHMNIIDYNKRVSDFLLYLGVEEGSERERLSNESKLDANASNYISYLNPEFNIYRFQGSIRIINVGKASLGGQIVYSVSTSNITPNWQSNSTYSLSPGTYYVSIGDKVGNIIVNQETKEFIFNS